MPTAKWWFKLLIGDGDEQGELRRWLYYAFYCVIGMVPYHKYHTSSLICYLGCLYIVVVWYHIQVYVPTIW